MFKNLNYASRKFISLLTAVGLGVVISLVIIPILLISINQVVKNGENRFTELEVNRVENIIQEEINRASRTLGDWSNWNDTYQFAQYGNQDYIENNLSEDTYLNLDIDEILILNNLHQLIYQGYYDNLTQSVTETKIDTSILLNDYPELASINFDQVYKGLALSQDQAMVIVANPILTSFSEGPSQGTIIFIKFFDEYTVKELSQLTLRNVDLYATNSLPNASLSIPNPSVLSGNVYVHPMDTNTVVGIKYLKDLQGKPLLLLKVENPRELFLQGRTTKLIVTGILSFLIVCLSISAYFFTNAVLSTREHKKEEEIAIQLLEKTRQNAIELEQKVIERTKELELKNKDLETFNYTISHDLKTPLRGISGYSTLLMNEHSTQLDTEGMNYLRHLVDGAARMNKLIEDLLLYTRTERHNITRAIVDIGELIDTLLLEYDEDLSNRSILIKKNLKVDHLLIDRDGITLVLRNLLDNAIKFTQKNPTPEIVISSKAEDDTCTISVADNGIGFDLEFQEKVFEIFQRLHRSEEYPGTGIGLALVKKTVDRLGGRVYVQSEVGVGSTFYLELPLD